MADIPTIAIFVQSPSGERFEAVIPVDVKINKLAADFFENQGWPLQDSRGRGQRAVVELVNPVNPDDTKRINGDLAITDAGIRDGDTLRIFPESIAGCFLGHIPIVLASGQEKPIRDIVVGDALLSIQLDTEQLTTTHVAQVFKGLADGYLILNETCYVTESHPIWCNGGWQKACELKVGDKLLTAQGNYVKLESITYQRKRVQVYNLHVTSDQHAFFASGLLVHNMQYKEMLSSIPTELAAFLESMDIAPQQRESLRDIEQKIETIGFRLTEVDELENRVQELEFKLRKIAEAFELLGYYLQRVEFVPARKTSTPLKIKKITIAQVHIDSSINEFNEAEQQKFIEAIAQKTKIPVESVKLLDISSGSVLITMEMPETAALELMKLYINSHPFITNLKIEKIELRPLLPIQQTHPKQLMPPRETPIRILFLAANPDGTSKLRLDEEAREIDDALLQKAEFRDKFEIVQQWAVRVSDLQSHLLRFQPDIVHFSGHGSSSNEIILEDANGMCRPVSKRALGQLFSVLKDNIRCVVLNACYSEPQAQAIAEYIECVIGMSKAIGDASAISFAKSFYQALGYGRSVDSAFKLGIGQIDLENLEEQYVPQLIAIKADPKEVLFV